MVNNLSVAGLTVNCRTNDMLMEALESVWKFYPDMKMVVVDGAAKNEIKHEKIMQLPFAQNIGHGPGISEGMYRMKSDIVFLFDTDIIMENQGFIEACLDSVKQQSWYGVGSVQNIFSLSQRVGMDVTYLDPYACLLNRYEFFKHRRPVDHGFPFISTCYDITKKGREDLLVNSNVEDYINHVGRKTFLSLNRRASYTAKNAAYESAGVNVWSEETF